MASKEELQKAYTHLRDRVLYLSTLWIMFRQLFATEKKRVDLMNRTAPAFFTIVQYSFVQSIAIRIRSITDRPESQGRRNLSLAGLVAELDFISDDRRSELEQKVAEISREASTLRKHVNRLMAHDDWKAALKLDPAPDLNMELIEQPLEQIKSMMNDLSVILTGEEQDFDIPILIGDGDHVIKLLERAELTGDPRRQLSHPPAR